MISLSGFLRFNFLFLFPHSYDIMRTCWQSKQEDRPTFSHLVQQFSQLSDDKDPHLADSDVITTDGQLVCSTVPLPLNVVKDTLIDRRASIHLWSVNIFVVLYSRHISHKYVHTVPASSRTTYFSMYTLVGWEIPHTNKVDNSLLQTLILLLQIHGADDCFAPRMAG